MIPKEERLKYRTFTTAEKVKCMDKIIRYCKENTSSIGDKYGNHDLYDVCKVVACTDLFDFIADHVVE